MVEQGTENPRVGGSIPPPGTRNRARTSGPSGFTAWWASDFPGPIPERRPVRSGAKPSPSCLRARRRNLDSVPPPRVDARTPDTLAQVSIVGDAVGRVADVPARSAVEPVALQIRAAPGRTPRVLLARTERGVWLTADACTLDAAAGPEAAEDPARSAVLGVPLQIGAAACVVAGRTERQAGATHACPLSTRPESAVGVARAAVERVRRQVRAGRCRPPFRVDRVRRRTERQPRAAQARADLTASYPPPGTPGAARRARTCGAQPVQRWFSSSHVPPSHPRSECDQRCQPSVAASPRPPMSTSAPSNFAVTKVSRASMPTRIVRERLNAASAPR